MPVISPHRTQGRCDGILDAARTACAGRGFADVPVNGIAKRAGVSDGLAYRCFENKRDLMHFVPGVS